MPSCCWSTAPTESCSASSTPTAPSTSKRTRALRQRIGARQAVFHRAFDVTPDPFRALEELIDLGITRVLTSGQKNGAPEGAGLIKQLLERAEGRIEVLPGAGITVENVRQLLERTGCAQVHLTAFSEQQDSSTLANADIYFGAANGPEESKYDLDRPRVCSTNERRADGSGTIGCAECAYVLELSSRARRALCSRRSRGICGLPTAETSGWSRRTADPSTPAAKNKPPPVGMTIEEIVLSARLKPCPFKARS